MANPLLTLMTFPQRWNAAAQTLEVRIAALPFTDPLSAIAPGEAAFADTDLEFQFRIVASLANLPKSPDAAAPVAQAILARPNRRALLEHLRERFDIQTPPPAAPQVPGTRRVKKYLPPTYREAFSFRSPQHQYVVTDTSYRCCFETAQEADPNRVPETRVSWGEVLGYLLRNRLLAEQAGLLFQFDLPVGASFAAGGWLWVEPQRGTAFANLADLRRYAARIPALAAEDRPVFGAIQFPVDLPPLPSEDAHVFIEAETYADGFAKIVHGAQPVATGAVDTEPGGAAPVRDRGIRIGWDDEQVTTWLNRQIGLDPFSGGAPKVPAPAAVLGYRVDVRPADGGAWSSLSEVEGDIVLDAIAALPPLDLGRFQGEFTVDTLPLQLQGKKTGDFWLPSHFVAWSGGSIVLTDAVMLDLDNRDDVLAAQRFTAVGAGAVPLRYGRDYEFRVRLADLSSGGPSVVEEPWVPGEAPRAVVAFRRHVPPKAPVLVRSDGAVDPVPPTQFELVRPRLAYPDVVFAQGAAIIPDLIAERDRILALPEAERLQEVALPDPDAAAVRITVAARQLALDAAEFRTLYEIDCPFGPLDLSWVDAHDATTLAAPAPGNPLPLPTARDLRVSFRTVGRDTPDYFGSEQARFSVQSTVLSLRAPSLDETDLYLAEPPSERLRAFYLLPDLPATGLSAAVRKSAGLPNARAIETPARLAEALNLEHSGLNLWARPGRRTVFAAAPAIQHQLGADRASIRFGSETDLVRHWIVALHLKLDRDWTWDALEERGAFRILRDGVLIATVDIPRVVGRAALRDARRGLTELLFFDAIDAKPLPGQFPDEITLRYSVEPVFRSAPGQPPDPPAPAMLIRLPVTTPPTQTPKLVSAGIALSPFSKDERYSSTAPRRRMLWLEFDRPPDDRRDRYYCRVLANSPDPILISMVDPLPDPPEPELPIPPEPIRTIVPNQSADDSGADAMTELKRSPDGATAVHCMVPLPDNMDENSLELFGFFTYELRVGHNRERWCTAHGRWGPPLRVTGVQHPAPPLACQVSRAPDRIHVRAPYATPVLEGQPFRPLIPFSDIWILLYAQVLQMDGASWRNVLLGRARAEQLRDDANFDFPRPQTAVEFANAVFTQQSIEVLLQMLGLAPDSPLSVLAVELIPEIAPPAPGPQAAPRRDPLGESLGDVRILRTSPLVPVPPVC